MNTILRPFGRLELIAHKPPHFGRDILLYAAVNAPGQGAPVVHIAKPLAFELVSEPDATEPEPFMRLDPDAARQLMDELWRAGVRPTEVGTGNELAAVKYHLEDMRHLAFRAETSAA